MFLTLINRMIPLAKVVVNFAIDALAQAIGNYIHAFNPEKIIIGGGMSKAGDALFIPLKQTVNKFVMTSLLTHIQ